MKEKINQSIDEAAENMVYFGKLRLAETHRVALPLPFALLVVAGDADVGEADLLLHRAGRHSKERGGGVAASSTSPWRASSVRRALPHPGARLLLLQEEEK